MGEILAANGVPIGPDKRPEQSFFARSDNIAFAQMGIPAYTLSAFNLHEDYHQVTDDVRAVDFEHMAAVIDAAVKAVGLLANGPAPVWQPGGKPEPRAAAILVETRLRARSGNSSRPPRTPARRRIAWRRAPPKIRQTIERSSGIRSCHLPSDEGI